MSLLKKLEDEAHLLLQELQQHVINQVSRGNKINPKLQELLNHLEDHVNPPVAEAPAPTPVSVAVVEAPVVVATPVVITAPADTNTITMSVTPATVPIQAPQTVAQVQSASNVAN